MTVSSLLLFVLRNWKLVGTAALAATALWWAYDRGRDAAEARHALAGLRAELALKTTIIIRNNGLLKQAETDALARSEALSQLEERVKDYEQELAARPGSDCALDERDVERLQQLRRPARR